MLLLGLLISFVAVLCAFMMFMPVSFSNRPTLKMGLSGPFPPEAIEKQKAGIKGVLSAMLAQLSVINKPLSTGFLGRRLAIDLGMAGVPLTPDEFLLIKEILLALLIWIVIAFIRPESQLFIFGMLMAVAIGYYMPEYWLRGRRKKIKDSIVKDLPDTVDLLGLCVNAGLDFMQALKYVIEKSSSTTIINELKNMLQEINMGKTRRDALRDLAHKYQLSELSTFSRTLIQADRMGTSVSEAFNMLSEDMREARYRRGEAVALKAPLKMLVPLLFFIFPVVGLLVAGPVFLDFFLNNPLQKLSH